MNTDFVLSQSDSRAMYLQIMEQIEQRVAVGDWPPGTKLPSIRALAISLKVSIITVKRAYLELEREGLIVTRQGRGCWVSEDINLGSLQKKELQHYLAKAADLAKTMSLSDDELIALLKRQTQS